MTFSNPSFAQQLACQQLTGHISAWAAIPAALTINHPIRSLPGSEPDVVERLGAFAAQVHTYERALLEPLKVNQGVLDYFLGYKQIYASAFSYSEAQWLDHPCRAQVIRDDMEPLSRTLRSLMAGIADLREGDKEGNVDALHADIETLRLIIASRAGWAEEVAQIIPDDPFEAITIFYDDQMRRLRALQPMNGALSVYHSRRPSLRPSAS